MIKWSLKRRILQSFYRRMVHATNNRCGRRVAHFSRRAVLVDPKDRWRYHSGADLTFGEQSVDNYSMGGFIGEADSDVATLNLEERREQRAESFSARHLHVPRSAGKRLSSGASKMT